MSPNNNLVGRLKTQKTTCNYDENLEYFNAMLAYVRILGPQY